MGNVQPQVSSCGNSKQCGPCNEASEHQLSIDAAAAATDEDEVILTSNDKRSDQPQAVQDLLHTFAEDLLENGGKDPVATAESLSWINFVAETLWPYVRKAAMQKANHIFHEKLDEQLARHPEVKLSEVKLDFDPGLTPPTLLALRVYQRVRQEPEEHSIQIDADISWYPDSSFHVTGKVVGRAKSFPIKADNLGVSEMSLRGTVSCILAPLLPYEPCVSAGQVFFLDSPAVDLKLRGVKRLGPIGGLVTNMMQGAVNQILAESYILPHRFVQNVEKNMPLETMVAMKSPVPMGILRVEVLEGRDLPAADINILTGKRTSDVFAQIRIGFDKIRTSTAENTTNPVWTDKPGHLFVYNVDQLVRITVEDDDVMGSDDLLGSVVGYNVYLLCKECAGKPDGAWLDVKGTDGAPAGRLRIRATWFKVGELGRSPMTTKAECSESPPYIVTVKLLGLDGPDDEDLTKARATVELLVDGHISHDERERHHASRLMDGLDAASHYAKNKVQQIRNFGFGHAEPGIPTKKKSSSAIAWGCERHVVDEVHHTTISPMTIRVMEHLIVNEGREIKDIADMFGVHVDTVNTAVALRSNFEVIWAEGMHFLQPFSNPITGKLKISVHVPTANRVRGANDQGLIGCFEVDLPPDETWGKPWTGRVRRTLSMPKSKSGKSKPERHSWHSTRSQAPEDRDEDTEVNEVQKTASDSGKRLKLGSFRKLSTSSFTGILDKARSLKSGRSSESAGSEEGLQRQESQETEESTGIVVEMIVEVRKLNHSVCALEYGQNLRDTNDLIKATQSAGVRISTE